MIAVIRNIPLLFLLMGLYVVIPIKSSQAIIAYSSKQIEDLAKLTFADVPKVRQASDMRARGVSLRNIIISRCILYPLRAPSDETVRMEAETREMFNTPSNSGYGLTVADEFMFGISSQALTLIAEKKMSIVEQERYLKAIQEFTEITEKKYQDFLQQSHQSETIEQVHQELIIVKTVLFYVAGCLKELQEDKDCFNALIAKRQAKKDTIKKELNVLRARLGE